MNVTGALDLVDVRPSDTQLARAEIEDAVAGAGWPWSRRLSRWIDALLVLEEGGA